jgi:hypothetical protein
MVLIAYGSEKFNSSRDNRGGAKDRDALMDWKTRAADELMLQYCSEKGLQLTNVCLCMCLGLFFY